MYVEPPEKTVATRTKNQENKITKKEQPRVRGEMTAVVVVVVVTPNWSSRVGEWKVAFNHVSVVV